MASRLATAQASEEKFVHSSGVSLCLLIDRRARRMRVVDFRSGPSPAKRMAVMEAARREGVDRIFTLVERDECGAWARMGFAREGSIPGFYKRSDAFVLGTSVPPSDLEEDTERSGTRLALTDAGEDVMTDRLYQAIRKHAKEREGFAPLAVKLQPARDADVTRAVAQAVKTGRALSTFEPFGRDVTRTAHLCTARGGLSLVASVESQTCFDNAFLELLTSPRTDKEIALTAGAVRQLCDHLFERGTVSCFALSPTRDIELGAIYANAGFRRTGVLRQHILIGAERHDAFLWSRKLAQPTDA
jgi:hypothetical protein